MPRGLTLAALLALAAAASPLCACHAYEEGLLGDGRPDDRRDGGPDAGGSGGGAGGDGGAGTDGGGMSCEPEPEGCNLLDDDCDGDVDEDTAAQCAETVVNAVTRCVKSSGKARCLKVKCLDGFADGDGDPTNGCETKVDEVDGGAELDAGA